MELESIATDQLICFARWSTQLHTDTHTDI